FVVGLIGGLAIGAHPTVGTAMFVLAVTIMISIVAGFVFVGMIVRIVQNHGDGREHSVDELWQSVKPIAAPLVLTGLLAMAAFFVLAVVCVGQGIAAGSAGLALLGMVVFY